MGACRRASTSADQPVPGINCRAFTTRASSAAAQRTPWRQQWRSSTQTSTPAASASVRAPLPPVAGWSAGAHLPGPRAQTTTRGSSRGVSATTPGPASRTALPRSLLRAFALRRGAARHHPCRLQLVARRSPVRCALPTAPHPFVQRRPAAWCRQGGACAPKVHGTAGHALPDGPPPQSVWPYSDSRESFRNKPAAVDQARSPARPCAAPHCTATPALGPSARTPPAAPQRRDIRPHVFENVQPDHDHLKARCRPALPARRTRGGRTPVAAASRRTAGAARRAARVCNPRAARSAGCPAPAWQAPTGGMCLRCRPRWPRTHQWCWASYFTTASSGPATA